MTIHLVRLDPGEDGDVESGELVPSIHVIAPIVVEPLGVEQVHDRINALTRHHLRHHHDIGREGFDDGGDVLQVAAAGRLEAEAGERGPFTGGGEVLDIETGDPQRARRSRRPLLGPRR